jgi:NADH-quinone oxidoreductase subunit M
MVAFSQIDIKKIIAYSSIAHMNFSLFGMFSFSILGLSGMCYLCLVMQLLPGLYFEELGFYMIGIKHD